MANKDLTKCLSPHENQTLNTSITQFVNGALDKVWNIFEELNHLRDLKLKYYVKYFRSCFNEHPSVGEVCPALHESVLNGDAKKLELLLMSGTDVDERFPLFYDATPLHIAADCNHKQQIVIMEILIKFGADLNAVDGNGNSALHIALQRNTSVSGHIVHFLIDNGCDVNLCNYNNRSQLYYACLRWFTDVGTILQKLALSGVKDETIDNDGNSLLMNLLLMKQFDTVEFLINHNICTRVKKRPDNNTLLHLAIPHAPYETINVILSMGIDIDAVNEKGHQALHIACLDDQYDSAQYLFDCCMNIDGVFEFISNHGRDFKSRIIILIWWHAAKLCALNKSGVHNEVCTMLEIAELNNSERVVNDCIEEIKKLRETWIGETSVTLYDFLMKDDSQVVNLLENKNVIQFLSSKFEMHDPVPYSNLCTYFNRLNDGADYQITSSEFPYYRGTIYCRFQLGLVRKSIIDKCKSLSRHCSLKTLPSLCLDIIWFKLRNSDLTKFIDAFKEG